MVVVLTSLVKVVEVEIQEQQFSFQVPKPK